MALSLGHFTFTPLKTAALSSSPAPPRVFLRVTPPTNLRGVRSVSAAASKAETERKPRGIMKPQKVSPEMESFLGGVTEVARTQALKKIWAYIKQHDLQDPENKRVVVCDEKLKQIFAGKDRVGFLEIAKLMNPHFLK